MHNYPHHEIPIKAKLEMLNDIALVIEYLHRGRRDKAAPLLNELKTRALFLDEQIQHDVLVFISSVEFQYDYDPWHKVTKEIQKSADKLIEDLGFPI